MTDHASADPDSGRRNDTETLVESLVVMVFATALFAVTFTFDEVPPILAQGIQPTAFPRAILILMFLLGGIQALSALRLSPAKAAALKPYKRVPPIVYLTGLALIAFAVVLPFVGTFPALGLFCFGLAMLWGERRWRLMIPSFAGFLAFIYVLFVQLLHVPLP